MSISRSKADGRILTKKRYLIPMEGTEYTIELDILGEYEGLKLAEVEFPGGSRTCLCYRRNGSGAR